MHNKICLVTGATSGIGYITARALAQQGATVVVAGRHQARAATAVQRIQEDTGNANVELMLADLSIQAQVQQLAAAFRQRFQRLDVLVNNAGALFTRRQLSADGIEMTLALNHLGYFVLTACLLDTLKASAPARIINVSSNAHQAGRLNFDDIQGQRRYGGWRAYSQSKLANLLFTYELDRRLQGTGVTVNTMHPGFVATSFGLNNSGLFPWLIRLAQIMALTPEQGAATIIYLATSPEVAEVSGKYFVNKRAIASSRASYDQVTARRLWDLSTQLTGVSMGGR